MELYVFLFIFVFLRYSSMFFSLKEKLEKNRYTYVRYFIHLQYFCSFLITVGIWLAYFSFKVVKHYVIIFSLHSQFLGRKNSFI